MEPESHSQVASGRSTPSLAGKVALVTGGTRGIGAAISESLAAQGATVAAGYSRDRGYADAFQLRLSSRGTRCTLHQGNVGAPADCRRTVEEVVEAHGRLDILVNNAGITIDKTVSKMADEDWLKVIEVNLNGAFFMSRAALAGMVERGSGRIVNIASIAGQMGNIGQANYAASKSGLFGLTKTMARESSAAVAKAGKLGEHSVGVTVNCVSPGIISTEMVANIPEKLLEKMKGLIPVGRVGRPEEVARVVAFLCADDSAYITGQVWSVDGGWDM
ncbi:MAG: beta-ketoacyl-ACP reductase [Nevskia sp.]|nr:beta-ketoacyl-ACP reductase [Nevskia sp.]